MPNGTLKGCSCILGREVPSRARKKRTRQQRRRVVWLGCEIYAVAMDTVIRVRTPPAASLQLLYNLQQFSRFNLPTRLVVCEKAQSKCNASDSRVYKWPHISLLCFSSDPIKDIEARAQDLQAQGQSCTVTVEKLRKKFERSQKTLCDLQVRRLSALRTVPYDSCLVTGAHLPMSRS